VEALIRAIHLGAQLLKTAANDATNAGLDSMAQASDRLDEWVEIDRLQGHTNSVYSVAFSTDGRRIVSGSHDNTLRIWDAATGKPIGAPLQGHTNSVVSVAFSTDGRRIVSGSDDNSLRLWDATPASSIRLACQQLRRHQLLWHPNPSEVGESFATMARQAQQVCRHPPVPPPLTTPRQAPSAPLTSLQHHLRQLLRLG
jgi:WD40 repeat protein